MKTIAVALLALVAVVHSKSINLEDVIDLEDLTAYDYHNKIGIPLANEIREYEAQPQSRIAGGSLSSLGQFPYQAGLVINLPGGQSVCGGVIVNNRRVLTAAHCWFDGRNRATSLTVVLGSITLFSGGTRLATSNVVMHASWNPNLIRDDIAIINLNTFGLNNNIQPIALPSGGETSNNFAGWTATASGFGRTGDGANQGISNAQRLSHVNLPVITNAVCSQTFGSSIVASNVCCSGAGGRSTCGGDSGGPLVVTSNGRRIVIGLTSFGSASGCTRGFPVAFVRITSYLSWINARL